MRQDRTHKPRPPLDQEGLERLALFYAGRYATTRAKLRTYLKRKVAERGWSGSAAGRWSTCWHYAAAYWKSVVCCRTRVRKR